MPPNLRCDGNVSGRYGADLLYFLSFLQSQFLVDGLLLFLLILQQTKKEICIPWQELLPSTNQGGDVPRPFWPHIVRIVFNQDVNPTAAWKRHYLELPTKANIGHIKRAFTRKTYSVKPIKLSDKMTFSLTQHHNILYVDVPCTVFSYVGFKYANLGKFLCISEVINSDGQKDIQESV